METITNIQTMNPVRRPEANPAQAPKKQKKANEGDFQAEMSQQALLQSMSTLGVVPTLSSSSNSANVQLSTEGNQRAFDESLKLNDLESSKKLAALGESQINQNGISLFDLKDSDSSSALVADQFEGLNLLSNQKLSSKVNEPMMKNQSPLSQQDQLLTRKPVSTQIPKNNDALFAGLKSAQNNLGVQTRFETNPNFMGQTLQSIKNPKSVSDLDQTQEQTSGVDFDPQMWGLQDMGGEFAQGEMQGESAELRGVARKKGLESEKSESKMASQYFNSASGDLLAVNRNMTAQSVEQKPIQNHLSGGEFLNALNLVKKGSGEQSSQSNLNNGNSGKENSSENGLELKNDLASLKKGKVNPQFEIQSGYNAPHSIAMAPGHSAANSSGIKTIPDIQAQVTSGSMAQDRLATDALIGMSTGIRTLSANGGGEVKIRLRPDGLGELNVRVTSNGNQVGLQIQASDEKAKKIIEESLSHLKDSLSAQNLTLSHVDLSVTALTQNPSGGDLSQDPKHSQANGGLQNDLNQNMNHSGQHRGSGQGSQSDLDFGNQSFRGRSAPIPNPGLASANSWSGRTEKNAQSMNQRLDVRG